MTTISSVAIDEDSVSASTVSETVGDSLIRSNLAETPVASNLKSEFTTPVATSFVGPQKVQESPASTEKDILTAATERIIHNLSQIADDEGYRQFLLAHLEFLRRELQTSDWRDKYSNYLKDLLRSMGKHKDPWIRDWIERNDRDPWDEKQNVSKARSYARDPVAFGKLASIMDFFKASATSSENPIRMRPPVGDILSGAMTKPPNDNQIRWIHLPANNMAWVEGLMQAIFKTSSADDADNTSHDQIIMATKFWAGRQNSDFDDRHHARFMRPTCLKLPQDQTHSTTSKKETDVVFFMPYLHWESDVARLHTYYIMENVDAQTSDGEQYTDDELMELRCNVDEKLLRKYLRSPSPLHVRRTLDQACYYTLPNTLIRDRDQVVLRYTKDYIPAGKVSPPVLMVDQCWLWVLGDIVVTCFPGCWVEEGVPNPEDPIDLLEKIVLDVQMRNTYTRISTSHDLAAIIIEHCAGNVVDSSLEKRREHDQFHFLEWFYRSIRRVITKQTDLFDTFCKDSEKLQNTLRRTLGTIRALSPDAYDEWVKTLEQLEEPSGGIYDITSEIKNLREIKDISDELHMIEDVLGQQRKSLRMFENVAHGDKDLENLASELLRGVELRTETIEQLHHDARHTYKWIVDLLDLKQKQANVSEARSGHYQAKIATKQAELANNQAVESAKQGTSIMLFTTVTILFLPLSSLASIFGLNAKELNGGNLSFGVVSAYLFPLSLFCVLFAFLLAFHNGVRQFFTLYIKISLAYLDRFTGFSASMSDERVRHLERKLFKLKMQNQGRKMKGDIGSEDGSDGDVKEGREKVLKAQDGGLKRRITRTVGHDIDGEGEGGQVIEGTTEEVTKVKKDEGEDLGEEGARVGDGDIIKEGFWRRFGMRISASGGKKDRDVV